MSRADRLAYYRGDVYRLRRADMKFLGVLVLLAGIVYLGCIIRLVPTTGFTDEPFDSPSLGLALYGLLMQIVALIIANLLASAAVGDAKMPDR